MVNLAASDFGLRARLISVLSIPEQELIDDGWLRSAARALGVDGASMLLRTGGIWRSVAATDEVAAHIDKVQLLTGEGPGVDALASGLPVQVADWIREAYRWPLCAIGLGIGRVGALFALPLRNDAAAPTGMACLGVLHFYRTRPGVLDLHVLNTVWFTAETMAATRALT